MKNCWFVTVLCSLVVLSALSHSSYVYGSSNTSSTKSNTNVYKIPKQYIVTLSQPSLLAFKQSNNQPNNAAKKVTTRQHQQIIKQQREAIINRIRNKAPNSQVLSTFDHIVNGLIIQTPLNHSAIQTLPDVKKVYPVLRYKALLNEVNQIIDSQAAWQMTGGASLAGKDIKIAVIDSGIAVNHPMFNDEGFTAPSAAATITDDYCQLQDLSFCNNKLIAARYYKPTFITDNELSDMGEFISPRGLSGHGTHVAGIATGREVTSHTGQVISGVAPGAYLMVYKALWGQNSQGSDIELLAAVEDAVKDGADIINNSWGGAPGQSPNSSLYQDIFRNLESNGIVLVNAAGNDGDAGIVCPGCIESGITVGASTTANNLISQVWFDSDIIISAPGDNITESVNITSVAKLAPESNVLGCDAFADDYFLGHIAIIERGICDFKVKANNAQNAGALAIIIFNNQYDGLISMIMGSAELPAVFISRLDGEDLVRYIEQNEVTEVTVKTDIEPNITNRDQIADFSGTGPNGDNRFMKPDLVAPGHQILSATTSEDLGANQQDYMINSGTSMATPVVSGAAAILKQTYPDWTAKQIKNVLMAWSEPNLTGVYGIGEVTPFQSGAGRLDLGKAIKATAYPHVVNLVKTSCVMSCNIAITLQSLNSEQQTWSAEIEFSHPDINASFSNNSISFDQNNLEKSIDLAIKYPVSLPSDWYFGRIIWREQGGATMYQTVTIDTTQTTSPLLNVIATEESVTKQTVSVSSSNISGTDKMEFAFEILGDGTIDSNNIRINGAENVDIQTIDSKNITLTADIKSGGILSSPAPINVDLSSLPEAVVAGCGNNQKCDEFLLSTNLSDDEFNFFHFGDNHQQLQISDNGFVLLGNQVIPDTADLYFNLGFPNSSIPNNIVAPFWSDFNLKNPQNSDDTGAGQILRAIITEADKRYFVVQWHDVQLYTDDVITAENIGISDPNITYRFQLIIEENSENKWFNYLSVPETPHYYSVGLEDSKGEIGFTHWFDGTGESEITSPLSLLANFSALQSASFELDILDNIVGFASDDVLEINEDNIVDIYVLRNDSLNSSLLISSVADHTSVTPIFIDRSKITLDPRSLAIVSEPTFGQAQVNSDGTIRYEPELHFDQTDSFIYQVNNELGESSQATVTIDIIPLDDRPQVLQIEGESTVNSGESITLSIFAVDVDSVLTYDWVLPEQFFATHTDTPSIEITAGDVAEDIDVEVKVIVSDSELSIERTHTITIKYVKKEDKGLFGLSTDFPVLLMMLMIFGFRVVTTHKTHY